MPDSILFTAKEPKFAGASTCRTVVTLQSMGVTTAKTGYPAMLAATGKLITRFPVISELSGNRSKDGNVGIVCFYRRCHSRDVESK